MKTKYDTNKSDLKKKIPDTIGLVKKLDYSAKITETEGKVPIISGLATNAALIAVQHKMPNVGNLVKKTEYDKTITEVENKLTDHDHDKCIITILLQNLSHLEEDGTQN